MPAVYKEKQEGNVVKTKRGKVEKSEVWDGQGKPVGKSNTTNIPNSLVLFRSPLSPNITGEEDKKLGKAGGY